MLVMHSYICFLNFVYSGVSVIYRTIEFQGPPVPQIQGLATLTSGLDSLKLGNFCLYLNVGLNMCLDRPFWCVFHCGYFSLFESILNSRTDFFFKCVTQSISPDFSGFCIGGQLSLFHSGRLIQSVNSLLWWSELFLLI